MNNQHSKNDVDQNWELTADHLFAIRDSLIELSFSMREILFELDNAVFKNAENTANEILSKLKETK